MKYTSIGRPGRVEGIMDQVLIWYRDGSLMPDVNYSVTILPLEENRRAAQNKLLWVWNAECLKFYGAYDIVDMHGQNKKDVLIPVLLNMPKHVEIALTCMDVIKNVEDPDKQNWIVNKLLPSRDLSVKEFALYLSALQTFWGAQGLNLTSDNDYYKRAFNVK